LNKYDAQYEMLMEIVALREACQKDMNILIEELEARRDIERLKVKLEDGGHSGEVA